MIWILRRHGPWVSGVIIGLAMVAAGSFFLVNGYGAKSDMRQQLIDEKVTTSSDASIPNALITNAATAMAQADVIKEHTLGQWGPYAEIPRDDPRRATFLDGLVLRSSLNLAVLGFGVADMAIGAGWIILAMGLATLLLAVPSLYFLAGMVVEQREIVSRLELKLAA